ncbi:hypothetical protein PIB30_069857 [Stylosanthes scabra]|uniref:Uncharacterized protein n=1 Tax=Stylosanthes scabra TaxID=79078 RepID=A0ABU6TQM8_9FABA|nr:hypothetical protein [Stylosanthes scabra]
MSNSLICHLQDNFSRLHFLDTELLHQRQWHEFLPYGKWHEEEEEVAPPIPQPVALADIPTPSAPSTPEPSRRDLMRALKQNEQISQNRQEQGAGLVEREDAEEDEDFQSAAATGDASMYPGGESVEDE